MCLVGITSLLGWAQKKRIKLLLSIFIFVFGFVGRREDYFLCQYTCFANRFCDY